MADRTYTLRFPDGTAPLTLTQRQLDALLDLATPPSLDRRPERGTRQQPGTDDGPVIAVLAADDDRPLEHRGRLLTHAEAADRLSRAIAVAVSDGRPGQ